MKVAIIGGGPSGILSAIMLKKNNKEFEVMIIEKEERLGKKIYVSGNGRCNLFNNSQGEDLYNSYRNAEMAKKVFESVDILKTLNYLGLDIKFEGKLGYPYTESAKTVMDVFMYHLKKENIAIYTKTEFNNYFFDGNKIVIETSKGMFKVDKLVIACGGKSSPVHGSNGSIYHILENHGYEITSLYPGLLPIKVKENVEYLKGNKVKCLVSLNKEGKTIYQEKGEVLFKEDGLSGIAIMNCSSIIARNDVKGEYDISLDLFPHLSEDELAELWIKKSENGYPYLDGSILTPIARYIEAYTLTKGKKNIEETKRVAKYAKNLVFSYDSLYSFKSSQVTVGGVNIKQIKDNFESLIENNVYILGETLDNDGLCGGFNLMWCFGTSLKFINDLIKK